MNATVRHHAGMGTMANWLIAREERLHGLILQFKVRRAARIAFRRLAAEQRAITESLFDAHFVDTQVAPMVARALADGFCVAPESITVAWFIGARAPGAALDMARLAPVTAAAQRLLGLIDEGLRPAPAAPASLAAAPQAGADPAALFDEALQANSNRSLDWLWLAEQLPGAFERRVCYERALAVDPGCAPARAGLASLDREDRGYARRLVFTLAADDRSGPHNK